MAINVLTETPDAIGAALAGADAETIAEVVRLHRQAIQEVREEKYDLPAYAPPCPHPDAYVSLMHGRLHAWEVVGDHDDAARRFRCARCGYGDDKA